MHTFFKIIFLFTLLNSLASAGSAQKSFDCDKDFTFPNIMFSGFRLYLKCVTKYHLEERTHLKFNLDDHPCKNGGVYIYNFWGNYCNCIKTAHFGRFCGKPCSNNSSTLLITCKHGQCPTDLPSHCLNFENHCSNGGFFVLKKSGTPICSCYGTGFWGDHCQNPCLDRHPAYCLKHPCPKELMPSECIRI